MRNPKNTFPAYILSSLAEKRDQHEYAVIAQRRMCSSLGERSPTIEYANSRCENNDSGISVSCPELSATCANKPNTVNVLDQNDVASGATKALGTALQDVLGYNVEVQIRQILDEIIENVVLSSENDYDNYCVAVPSIVEHVTNQMIGLDNASDMEKDEYRQCIANNGNSIEDGNRIKLNENHDYQPKRTHNRDTNCQEKQSETGTCSAVDSEDLTTVAEKTCTTGAQHDEVDDMVISEDVPIISALDSGVNLQQSDSIVSDIRSLQNDTPLTPQNCPICRRRQQNGNLTNKQRLQLFDVDSDNDTLLHISIVLGEVHLAKCLIEQAPDPECINIKDKNFLLTPLHLAVLNRRPDMIRYLLAHGADPESKDKDGNTPLHLACQNLRPDEDLILVKSLIAPLTNGLETFPFANTHRIPQDTHLKNYAGKSVLHLALENGNLNTILFLVGPYFRIDVNIQETTTGYSILHKAVLNNNYNMLKELLLIPEINVNSKDFYGRTPYDLAKYCGGKRMMLLLEIYEGVEGDDVDDEYYSEDSEDEE